MMVSSMLVYDPVAPRHNAPRQNLRTLDGLAGKVVGFIDNAKPNFHVLVDDIAELLVAKYGVASVIRHRKGGQVAVDDSVLTQFAKQCDLVIAGSGD
jgi:hypothetical protein